MTRARTFFRSSFGSALFGGIVAVAIGIVAIATGLISVDNSSGSAPLAATPITTTEPASSTGQTVNQVYQEDAQGVAFISAEQKPTAPATPFGGPSGGGIATGSGILIDGDGHVLTNAHVVDGSSSVTVKFGDGEPLPAKVLGVDDSSDVAVLSVDPGKVDAKPLQLGDSDQVKVGDGAIAIGNPYGLDRTVTSGIISALQRQISAPNGFTISDVIQTDAAINPGNSGGPLTTLNGEVVGINTLVAGRAEPGVPAQGIGFAIAINTAKQIADEIVSTGKATHPYVGVSYIPLTPAIAAQLNVTATKGALVQSVVDGSPAAKAGLQKGDIVTKVDGQELTTDSSFANTVESHKVGDTLTLTVVRNGQTMQVPVTLAERPAGS